MVLLNQVRSEKRALEMRVNELIARNNSLSTEKSTIQKRLDETQKARLALERKINSLQSCGQTAESAASLPAKPDPSVSILSNLQSRDSATEKRLHSSQTQIAGLERHLREWKTKANELEIKLRAAQKGPVKIDSAAKATVAGTVELNALKDKLAASKKELDGLMAKFEAQGQLLAEARKREAVERQKVELLEEELRLALKG
jgi:chromosome segregation ATPase